MAKNHTTVAEIHENDLHKESNSATFCIDDDKIRLYVGRVERETYNYLRANKFVATPKQSCDFVAVWSPKAEDIAFSLIAEDRDIEDEDYSPEERAADRAERFAGYRDKRSREAHGHADTYDNGPAAFGNQNAARAQRQANRHERHRDRALCQWSKAEYWQARTAGVISHALHRSTASVRRGRILTLEADQRKATPGGRWHEHLTMRLIYENAMLENEGGQASVLEMIPGGFFRGRQIQRINRSPATGRVVSVLFLGGSRPLNIERYGEDAYRAPTSEELTAFTAALAAHKATEKAAAPPTVSLINPTPADAQRLQDIWNAAHPTWAPAEVWTMTQAEYSARSKGGYGTCDTRIVTEHGTASRVSCDPGQHERCEVFKIRRGHRGGQVWSVDSVVCITDKTQKALPWQALADARAAQPTVDGLAARIHEINKLSRLNWLDRDRMDNPDDKQLWQDAIYTRLAWQSSTSQFGLTKKGIEILNNTPEPQEAPEPEPAAFDELHTTEAAVIAAGCLF